MLHRIYFPQPYTVDAFVEISGEEFHHAVRVVRVKEGEDVELFDGRGHAVRGRVVDLGRDLLRVRIDAEAPSRESPVDLCLAMSIINLEKFELVLQKATELGVLTFIPMTTGRVEIRPERYRGKQERWEKIVFEAVKQSGRSVIPKIQPPASFEVVTAQPGLKVLFEAEQESEPLPETLAAVTLLIGPEGGWTPDEIDDARGVGCLFQQLGPRRLRAETAAIVAATMISARYGDI